MAWHGVVVIEEVMTLRDLCRKVDRMGIGAFIRDHRWTIRESLWSDWGGVTHLVLHAATAGRGVVVSFACGKSSNDTSNLRECRYFALKKAGNRMCRACTHALELAGESGPIRRGGLPP
jgi:hypothetical protein